MRIKAIALLAVGIPLISACHPTSALPPLGATPAGLDGAKTLIVQRKSADPHWRLWYHAHGWFQQDIASWQNSLWITAWNSPQLTIIGMSGQLSHRADPLAAGILAVGSDGNLWIAKNAAIAKVTPFGSATVYDLSSSVGQIDALANGPDRALWFPFIGPIGNGVGRITTSGSFTEFGPFPMRQCCIAVGPDGNLWLGASQDPHIYKLSTKGVETAYPIPTSEALNIAAGSDGAIWYASFLTNPARGVLVRITAGGTVTAQYPTPGGGFVNSMVTGPDGALWTAGDSGPGGSGDAVFRFDPATLQWSEFSPPIQQHTSLCCSMAVGPDRNIYVNDDYDRITAVYIRMVITPTPDSITLTGPGHSQQLTVSESNFAGPWTVKPSRCHNIVTVMPQFGKGPFTVTSLGAGSCEIDISDNTLNTYIVPVTVH
jgi:virginiamycin B lyase